MVQQDIAFADRREDIAVLFADKTSGRGRNERLIFKGRPIEIEQDASSTEIEWTIDPVHVVVIEFQIGGQQVYQLLRHPVIHLQANGIAKSPAPHSLLNTL